MGMKSKLRKAVFFDRDGTLNVDHGYVHDWDNFAWIPGAQDAIKLANHHNYLVFVVTNQSGIGRGYFSADDVRKLHIQMNLDLKRIGAHIDAFEFCPHHPDATLPEYKKDSNYRKPAAGMLTKLINNWQIDTDHSFLIGDKESDVVAAKNANISGYLFTGANLYECLSQHLNS